jgi:hypothetical protein
MGVLPAIVIVVAALAQTGATPTESPAPGAAASPAPVASPTPPDESRPDTVITPTSDAERAAEGLPRIPAAPGPSPRPEAEEPVITEGVAEEVTAEMEPARKRWRIIPLFSTAVVYDDNIFLTNTDRVADVIWTIGFGLAVELGDFRGESENYIFGQWIGLPTIYTENSAQSAFNQSAALTGQYRWNRLVAQLDSKFSIFRGPSRQVNTITTTTSFANTLTFRYDYSDKTSFNLGLSQQLSLTETFTNTYQYEGRVGMDYQVFPKTRVGLQGVVGTIDQSGDPLQYYQQGLVVLNYTATGKLTFRLSAGVQALELQGNDTIRILPVFSLGVNYQPFDGTALTVMGYRNVTGSLIAGQDIIATGFETSVQQRFFQKFIAQLSSGYENDQYIATTTDEAPSDRVDNYVYIRPRLSYSFIEWLSASIFYEFRRTNSSDSESSFYDNRIGMEIATQF